MSDWITSRERYGEAFWRAHHEAWQQSVLNQREYCEAHGLPLKAFGNWRAKFKAEPQPPVRKLYRRGGLSHRLSHTLSHSLSHMTNDPLSRPIVHRRVRGTDVHSARMTGAGLSKRPLSQARAFQRWPAAMG